MKPKRKVVMRSPYRSVGLVACSWLQATPVEHESFLERRFIQRMLVTPGVTGIISQPFQINYGPDEEKSYTPDFLVHLGPQKFIVAEVKPEKFVEKFAETFDSVSAILTARQTSLHVVTDRMIDVGDIPDEIELVLRYARGNIPQAEIDEVLKNFTEPSAAIPLSDLIKLSAGSFATIYHLLGRNVLAFKDEISLSPNTKIQKNLIGDTNGNVRIPDWLDAATWNTDARIREANRRQSSPVRGCNHTPKLYMGDFQSGEGNS